jgi:hypothetical protein
LVESPGPIVLLMAAEDLIEKKSTHLQMVTGHLTRTPHGWAEIERRINRLATVSDQRRNRRPVLQ